MTRDATAAAVTETKADVPKPFAFVELSFSSGFLRVNSTDRTVRFDPGTGEVDFLGVGILGTINLIGEGHGLQAQGVECTLSGINAANVALAFQNSQRRAGRIWTGFFDSNFVLVADPILVFSGLIDSTHIELGETATVTVQLESRLITWARAKIKRYTNDNQQQEFTGDKFFEFIGQTVDKEIFWGIAGGDKPPRVIIREVPTESDEPPHAGRPDFPGFDDPVNAIPAPRETASDA